MKRWMVLIDKPQSDRVTPEKTLSIHFDKPEENASVTMLIIKSGHLVGQWVCTSMDAALNIVPQVVSQLGLDDQNGWTLTTCGEGLSLVREIFFETIADTVDAMFNVLNQSFAQAGA